MDSLRSVLSSFFAFAVLGIGGFGVYWIFHQIWEVIVSADNQVSVAIIAGFFSIIVSTITVSLGRYFERKRQIEADFRGKKIEIYDEFLTELFKVFHNTESNESADNIGELDGGEERLASFLRDWQRTLVLWGGPSVLKTYFLWMSNLKRGQHSAKTIYLMDDFFRALRKDIGQSSLGLERGAFSHFILRDADLFLRESKRNPEISLDELAQLEEQKSQRP